MVTLIGVGCTILGLLVGVLTFGRNRDKDVRADAARTAIIETKLDNISLGINSIQLDYKTNEQKMENMFQTVIRVEESAKSAHKRIDAITTTALKQEVS